VLPGSGCGHDPEDTAVIDYQIQPSTRRCCVSGRELQVDERYYSVLLEEQGKFVRKDYSLEAWQGAPEGAFRFWMGRLAAPQGKRRQPIDDEMLLECFERLEGQLEPSRLRFRYVIALLLMRRRRLRFEETQQDGSQEVLILRCTRSGARHLVVNPGLTEEELATVQDDVFQALGWD
jgi:hypothetical protein